MSGLQIWVHVGLRIGLWVILGLGSNLGMGYLRKRRSGALGPEVTVTGDSQDTVVPSVAHSLPLSTDVLRF